MAKQETRRQHFVPRTYLKRFASQRGNEFFIHALSNAEPKEDKIFELNIANAGVQKDLYTLPGENEAQRQMIENFYSDNFETHYEQLYEILTNQDKTEVNAGERELIIGTVVTMLYRTTKWINSHNQFMERVLTDMYHLTKQVNKDYFMFEKEKISIKDRTLDQLIDEYKLESKPSQLMTQLDVAIRLLQVRGKADGIYVIRLSGNDHEFITCDNPVSYFRVGVNEIMPFDPRNVLSLPLDKKHLLMLMPYTDDQTKHLIMRTTFDGKMALNQKITSNFTQWRNSERFILGGRESILSYLATKEETEKPLTPEELKNLEPRRKAFDEVVKKAKDLGLI